MPEHEEEFAAAVRRAGVTIPPERWDVMREAYLSMQRLLSVLADPLTYLAASYYQRWFLGLEKRVVA
jgi:hypothetical protein